MHRPQLRMQLLSPIRQNNPKRENPNLLLCTLRCILLQAGPLVKLNQLQVGGHCSFFNASAERED